MIMAMVVVLLGVVAQQPSRAPQTLPCIWDGGLVDTCTSRDGAGTHIAPQGSTA
jgi:hypothetical protein